MMRPSSVCAGTFAFLVCGLVSAAVSAEEGVIEQPYDGFTVWVDCQRRGAVRFEYTATRDTGNLPRRSSFGPDPDFPAECQQTTGASYKTDGPRYDRGHLVPANHLDDRPKGIRQSNFMTNILPQAANMNYSLLYFVKGAQARVFHPDRLPMQVCPHCAGDLRDYGGYKAKMNPKGVNLSDVWWDIAPVRHAKYKRRNGANELPLKVLDRVIEMSTDEGDLVFDPFGGAGTTYMAAELKDRRWLGIEIGPTDDIVRRFSDNHSGQRILLDQRSSLNTLFTEQVRRIREKTGWWTCESVREKQSSKEERQLELEQM